VISPARVCAYTVIRRVFEQNAYADRALTAEAAGLDARDRALATQLAYGTVQRRATLDHVAAQLSSRKLEQLDPPVLAAIRLGLFQVLYLGGVADHAAVNESVELCKRATRGGAGLVNAVLRRATREGRAIVDALDDRTAQGAAIAHSVPGWLAELWWDELGPDEARALLRRVNEPAEASLRVNALKAPDGVEMPVQAHGDPELPEAFVLEAPFDVHGSELFRAGTVMPQSRASMLVARTLDPQPGERVLDLCAAPGAKTTHLSALMGGSGSIVAVEANKRRAGALARTCELMGAANVEIRTEDARAPRERAAYDRVLADPPCSGLGTLQSRPDLRWRGSPQAIRELSALQTSIATAAADALKPGGVLVYSVCTISAAEGDRVLDRLLKARSELTLEAQRQLLPHVDGTDGFFIARLRSR
jgi:16S rRNA (cytosine967-C5)-methyltransferase